MKHDFINNIKRCRACIGFHNCPFHETDKGWEDRQRECDDYSRPAVCECCMTDLSSTANVIPMIDRSMQ
jgi:hypothetical protein